MGGDEWDPQRQQALRMDGIIIVVIIIIVVVVIIIVVVVVVGKGKAIKRKYKLLVTPASGSPEVDQGLIKRSLKNTLVNAVKPTISQVKW